MFTDRILVAPTLDDEPQNGINQSVAMAIAGTSTFGSKTNGTESYQNFQQVKFVYLISFKLAGFISHTVICSKTFYS